MEKGRLEAFSDGVIAIIITIMVLELKAPMGGHLHDLRPVLPALAGYVLSFLNVGMYWSNHHHMIHAVRKVDGRVLWSNLHLLFWLSLVPFATAWMGEYPLTTAPVALYGIILLMSAFAYQVLEANLVRLEGRDAPLAQAVRKRGKEKLSLTIYAVGLAAAFFAPVLSLVCYLVVAVMWVVPDRRVERQLRAR
jgi:uncharacterized membrane protein